MKNYKIVIIGGTSKFGQLWQRYFEEKGHEVIASSRSTDIKPENAVTLGDIIIFSVSIRYTVDTIKKLVPLIPDNKLVMDFTGIKKEASNELIKYQRGEVVATHPMFGPWIKKLDKQNIAYDPIKTGEKWNYIFNIWKNDGANLIEMSSSRHDELVAIVQSSVHFINLMIGHILQQRGIHPDELMVISTPISRMQLFILSRFLNQEASLYTDMQICNSIYRENIIPEFRNYVNKMSQIIDDKQSEEFEKEFNKLKNFIGQDFINMALKISSEIDEKTRT